MVLFFQLVRWLHVAAGGVALFVFWIPLVAKKGGPTHRRAGWVYYVAALGIAVTALVGCARMLGDDRPRNDRPAIFFAYVALLAAANALIGLRALRTKRRTTSSRSPRDLAPAVLLGLAGLATTAFGLRLRVPLYVAFGVLGAALGVGQLRFWLRAPRTHRDWLFAHMTGMGTSCIATITAFLVLNAPRFGVGTFNVVVWVSPAVVGTVGLFVWRRRIGARARWAESGRFTLTES